MSWEIILPAISVGASRIVSIDGQDDLDSAELFTGTPTIVEVTTTDLTLSSKQVNTVALVVLDRDVAIGKAIQFRVSGAVAGKVYEITVTCGTTTTPAETIVYTLKLPVV